MRARAAIALVWLTTLLACDDKSTGPGAIFQPTQPRLLSTGSPSKDEDPSVLRANDGTLYVAWFSDRTANGDIYISRTRDGVTWSGAQRITTSNDGDFYPTLIQATDGTIHLTWFRWYALERGHIWHVSSDDGINWSSGTQVTTAANVDDWVPTIAEAPGGALRIYFVSDVRDAGPSSDLYVASRAAGATTWDVAVPATALNSATEHDQLPFVARTGATVSILWVRHDTSEPKPWLNPKSQLWYSASNDGLSWSAPLQVTNDAGNVINLFPSLYVSSSGERFALWLTSRSGSPEVVELAVADLGQYPTGLSVLTALPDGYSHRIARTPTPDVYLGAWVQGPEGAQDIYVRFFEH